MFNLTTCDHTITSPCTQLIALEQFDRENQTNYHITVEAVDLGEPSQSSYVNISVEVLDTNDNTPFFIDESGVVTQLESANIVEKSPVGSLIAWIRAKDLDAGENANITYSLKSSDISTYFSVDQTLGIVKINEQIVINTLVNKGMRLNSSVMSLNLTVFATDHGQPRRNASLRLNVNIEPINDNAPYFPYDMFNFTVSENLNGSMTVFFCLIAHKLIK